MRQKTSWRFLTWRGGWKWLLLLLAIASPCLYFGAGSSQKPEESAQAGHRYRAIVSAPDGMTVRMETTTPLSDEPRLEKLDNEFQKLLFPKPGDKFTSFAILLYPQETVAWEILPQTKPKTEKPRTETQKNK